MRFILILFRAYAARDDAAPISLCAPAALWFAVPWGKAKIQNGDT